ncbi:MAG TPA: hypothetical protein VFU02_17110 [Polyangiaceae bacterium]|nr:hypothetical protein [Polyangiaceae bacterium]
MKTSSLGFFSLVTLLGSLSVGCASTAPPFDTMKSANVTAFRLQNFEPPPQAAPAAGQPAQPGAIPGVPPEIQAWVQQGAQALQQLLPPGLALPGAPAAAVPAPAPEAPRFHGFRILGQTQVMDPELKEKLGEIFGDEDNFDNNHAACGYSEMGISFSPQPGVQNDMLISFSCNQVLARTFAWPHPAAGMKPDMVKELTSVVQKIFPPGT